LVPDGTSPADELTNPEQIDLWSFAVTLYEMATGSPLFPNSYDRATPAALAQLQNWTGLEALHLDQVENLHGTVVFPPWQPVPPHSQPALHLDQVGAMHGTVFVPGYCVLEHCFEFQASGS
jgi:serine/threonine protein kinase